MCRRRRRWNPAALPHVREAHRPLKVRNGRCDCSVDQRLTSVNTWALPDDGLRHGATHLNGGHDLLASAVERFLRVKRPIALIRAV